MAQRQRRPKTGLFLPHGHDLASLFYHKYCGIERGESRDSILLCSILFSVVLRFALCSAPWRVLCSPLCPSCTAYAVGCIEIRLCVPYRRSRIERDVECAHIWSRRVCHRVCVPACVRLRCGPAAARVVSRVVSSAQAVHIHMQHNRIELSNTVNNPSGRFPKREGDRRCGWVRTQPSVQ